MKDDHCFISCFLLLYNDFFKQHALQYIKFFYRNSIAQEKIIRPVVIIVNIHYPFLTLNGPIFRIHLFTYSRENDCIAPP